MSFQHPASEIDTLIFVVIGSIVLLGALIYGIFKIIKEFLNGRE